MKNEADNESSSEDFVKQKGETKDKNKREPLSSDVFYLDLGTDFLFVLPSLIMMPIYGMYCYTHLRL